MEIKKTDLNKAKQTRDYLVENPHKLKHIRDNINKILPANLEI